ncbi:hypothetical protein FHW58_002855 [Duganella sp. 1224]|uniref:hypothetical protein n=1 Tax=Duganella sp. 1224 TaxID=2587052 RepID=UPI0015C8FA74|nr:hypothetical protein [Duganella sp. 1224]NYE61648.1 hypothetical protein [Duganella sp. 1224]
MIEQLLHHLRHDGFQAELDDDGDLAFRYEGKHYALCFDADDPMFTKLILPNVWEIDSQTEYQRALAAADYLNRRLKLLKAYTMRDQLWLSVEMWMADPAGWQLLLPRAIRLLAHGLHLLTEQMRDAPALPAAPFAAVN